MANDFDGVIDSPAGWPSIPQLSVEARARGGANGPMNAQAVAMSARINDLDARANMMVVPTVLNDIRAITPPVARVGQTSCLEALGYYQPGDGGGGTFFWDASSTEDDDGALIIKPNTELLTGRWKRVNTNRVPVEAFGVSFVEGVDDSAGWIRVFNANVGVDLGMGKVSDLATPIDIVSTSRNWDMVGYASIRYTGPYVNVAVRVIMPERSRRRISGMLSMDAQRNAACAWYFLQANSGTLPIELDLDIGASNTHRNGPGVGIDSSIQLEGILRGRVHPEVRRATAATSAIEPGLRGVCGFMIKARSNTPLVAPLTVTVDRPLVHHVTVEDSVTLPDQDGIRLYSADDRVDITSPYDTKFLVEGGELVNCRGRSIKFQNQFSSVTGTHIVRENGLNGFVGLNATVPDIDFQTGGGQVSDVTFRYKGCSANGLVLINTASDGKNIPYGLISDIQFTQEDVNMDTLFRIATRTNTQVAYGSITGVRHRRIGTATLDYFVALTGRTGQPGAGTCMMSDCQAEPSQGWVYGSLQSNSYSYKVNMRDCVNSNPLTYGSLSYVRDVGSSADPLKQIIELSQLGCVGFLRTRRVQDNTSQSALRLNNIAPEGSRRSPQWSIDGFDIPAGGIVEIPYQAYNVQTRSVKISVGGGSQDQVEFAVSAAGIAFLAKTDATTWVIGSGADPGTGTYRIWLEGGTVLKIRNSSTSQRAFGVIQF